MCTLNVNTATSESAEHDNYFIERFRINSPRQKLSVIPLLFCSPVADTLAADWLRQHSDYDGGSWSYYLIPQGLSGKIAPHTTISTSVRTGFIAPEERAMYRMDIPGNYFSAEVSAQAAGIIATLMIMNALSWKTSEMGDDYAGMCTGLIKRQDALKDFISIMQHPERNLIWRAID